MATTSRTGSKNGTNRNPTREERQKQIVDAAAEIFCRQGYEQTSTQEIAEAVGMLKGSLYHYIASKEDILHAIVSDVHRGTELSIDRVRSLEGTPLMRIRAFVIAHILHNVARLVKMAVFFQDFRSLSEVRQREIVAERDRYDRFFRDLIREGQEAAMICPDIHVDVVGFGILGLSNWIYQWYNPRGPVSPEQLADAYADFVLEGLACDPATHRPGHRTGLGALSLAALAALQLPDLGTPREPLAETKQT
jgi:TetR/AcrR family transcriptional regulator, cholesterol catabolism regulator